MKTMRWVVLAMITLGAAGWILARAESSKGASDDAEVRALRQQVELLQTRLRTLEERLAKVESKRLGVVPRIEILPKSPGDPPAYRSPSLPDILGKTQPQPMVWGQCEINGWDFHFIPCAGQ